MSSLLAPASTKQHFTLPVYLRSLLCPFLTSSCAICGIDACLGNLRSNRLQVVYDSSLWTHNEVVLATQVHTRIEFNRLRLDVP